MREVWVRLKEWSKEMVTASLEGGADALVVPAGWQDRIKALGRIATVSPDGDLKPGSDVHFESLKTPEDEKRIARILAAATVVLEVEEGLAGGSDRGSPWEVIPLENLVARGGRLLVPVKSLEDIDLALGILEKGVTGVVLDPDGPEDLLAALDRVKRSAEKQPLETGFIESIRPVGMGDRVCLDTCTLMTEGEGVLVGNSSAFLFLVQAEVLQNPYVAPRPFRVNAGPVHAYVRVPGGATRYLSELQAGDPVLLVHALGTTQVATVGRCKVERRPLLLIEASLPGAKGSLLVQNAETIRLTGPDGEAVSVVELRPGDPVMVATEQAGRHFGMKIEETIRER